MLNSINSLRIGLILTACIMVFALVLYFKTSPKTAYININEVFNQFDLKKQLEKKYLQTKQSRDKILDSLKFNLQTISNKLNNSKLNNDTLVNYFNFKKEEFYQKKDVFDSDNQNLSKQLDSEVLSQLNQYVKDFGKEKKYDYIFGTDGNGSIMYATESNDITKEIVEYINLKYKGIK